ncbi:MAG: Hsp70 family protein [Planctomycetaceae bacterium]|nr:Hsp70 family protein [Planctomycetaceae bacterium]
MTDTTHSVGIDLGTTYSCIAYLNEQAEPVSLANQEGELSTPSVVMYDHGEEIVGTEALRNAIVSPSRVIQNAKRFVGTKEVWTIDGTAYTPVDVSASILRKLLRDATRQIGPIQRAVITVPAQFSEAQRLATVAAGRQAGLTQVDIINEPVAAALCYVLGAEGLWFSELAAEQRILVYDLGGGTFDLSLVSYSKDHVRVIASTGDLRLGGIDWNQCLLNAAADQFMKEFGKDPRKDPESLQHLSLEVEQCKRSLTVRSKAALIVQHAGHRKTYQIEREQFDQITRQLVRRTEEITRKLIDAHRRGSSHLDLTVLSTGGSSRMPMIEAMLAGLKGTTISKALSPDQSIAHGAAIYAGMLLTNSDFVHSIIDPQAAARLSQMRQQSVNARALGILVRDMGANRRVPFYLIPANTALPASVTETFGTVIPNQQRVRLFIIESGGGPNHEFAQLGTCTIDKLPPNLPAESRIAVTISYDASARVTVSARDKTSGKEARTEIERGDNLVFRDDLPGDAEDEILTLEPCDESTAFPVALSEPKPVARPAAAKPTTAAKPTIAAKPAVVPVKPAAERGPAVPARPAAAEPPPAVVKSNKPTIRPVPAVNVAPLSRKPETGEIIELPRKKKPAAPAPPPKRAAKPPRPGDSDPGAEEFWRMLDQQ